MVLQVTSTTTNKVRLCPDTRRIGHRMDAVHRPSHLVCHLGAVLVERLVRYSAAEAHGGNSPGLSAGNPAVTRLEQVLRHLQMGV